MKKMATIMGLALLTAALTGGCAAKTQPAQTEAAPAAVTQTAAVDGAEALVGEWRSKQDGQIISFGADGTYSGMKQKHYQYLILDGKQLKIINPEYPDGSDSVVMDFTLEGDVLTTVLKDYKVEWERVK